MMGCLVEPQALAASTFNAASACGSILKLFLTSSFPEYKDDHRTIS